MKSFHRAAVVLVAALPLALFAKPMVDDARVHTASYFAANADGSVDLVLRPCSFAFLELE